MMSAGRSLQLAEFEDYWSSMYAMQELLMRYGIAHLDISPNDGLWDEQAEKLMVIDFEYASTATKEQGREVKKEKKLQDKDSLKEMSPNKTLEKRKEIEQEKNVAVRPTKLQKSVFQES